MKRISNVNGISMRLSSTLKFMYLLCFLFVFFMQASSVQAQNKVYGLVTNSNGTPMPDATVLLLRLNDSVMVKGTSTSAEGHYSFEAVDSGNYLIAASYAGFKKVYTDSFRIKGNEDRLLTEIRLSEKETQLNSVVIEAKKPLVEQKADRMVINVAGSVTSAGSNALEVLMHSPGVVVDQQNNALSMNGKEGVMVMINGKLSRMPIAALFQMLAGMDAGTIDKIELITTPPANYDAEGNAGFINIITKAGKIFGTNGSFTVTAGYGKKPVGGVSLNFNHRKGKWNVYGDYSYADNRMTQYVSLYRKVKNGEKIIESDMNTDRDAARRSANGRMGLDWEPDNKTTLGVLVSGFRNLYTMTAINKSNRYTNGMADTAIVINNNERHPLDNYSANLNLVRQFNKQQRITVNVDYVYYRDNNTADYFNHYFNGAGNLLYDDSTKSYKNTPIKFWVASADYTKKLGSKSDFTIGVKSTLSRFVNDVQVDRSEQSHWTTDMTLTSTSELEENINAAYALYTVRFNDKTTGKAGLRYENTYSNLGTATTKNIVNKHYGKLFPSVFISQKLNSYSAVNLSYSSRITRPTFNDMAPFVYFIDPNTFFEGNPALQPSVSRMVKADYTYRRYVLSLAYTFETDPITNFSPRIDPVTNKQTFVSENQRNAKTGAILLAIPVTVSHWWKMQNNLSVLWQDLNAFYNADPLHITQQSFSINTTQTFALPSDYTVELAGYYRSGSLMGVYRTTGLGSMDLGIQKKLAGNKSSFRFTVSDVFGGPVFKQSINFPEENLVGHNSLRFTNTIFRLSFTKSFGNDKVKAVRSRTTGSEEEHQRVNSN